MGTHVDRQRRCTAGNAILELWTCCRAVMCNTDMQTSRLNSWCVIDTTGEKYTNCECFTFKIKTAEQIPDDFMVSYAEFVAICTDTKGALHSGSPTESRHLKTWKRASTIKSCFPDWLMLGNVLNTAKWKKKKKKRLPTDGIFCTLQHTTSGPNLLSESYYFYFKFYFFSFTFLILRSPLRTAVCVLWYAEL